MTKNRITENQVRIYMQARKEGLSQKIAAAKSGFSDRTAKRFDAKNRKQTSPKKTRTRKDPFSSTWNAELLPLLEKTPTLQAVTLLRYLQDQHPDQYPDSLLRTLQRRVQLWKGLHGPEKEVIFRQNHPPGWQCLSDFTNCNQLKITICSERFDHLLYHFWLPFSKWQYAFVVTGGESLVALIEGLQQALWTLGGVPQTHRTDSLSAAYKNRSKEYQADFTQRYHEFCQHYDIEPTRHNKGVKHENGAVESAHRHLKNRIDQALLIRGSRDFESLEDYRAFVDEQTNRHNSRIQHLVAEERKALKPLPKHKSQDFEMVSVGVTTSSTVTIRQVRYSVPSQLIGRCLKAHLYDDRIELFLASTKVLTLERLRWKTGQRPHSINYRHLIHALVRKPQTFRNYQFKEALFPTISFKKSWELLDQTLDPRSACKEYVALLKLAAENDELQVSHHLDIALANNKLPKAGDLRELFPSKTKSYQVKVQIAAQDPAAYNKLLCLTKGEQS